MKEFATLFFALDQTTKTSQKTAALASFLKTAPEQDRLWAVALFTGRRPKRAVTTTLLREWAAEAADIPLWLFEEAYPVVGDLAETIALILPANTRTSDRGLTHWIAFLRDLTGKESDHQKAAILDAWEAMDTTQRFLFNKLLTGGFRIGVSQKLMTRAIAQETGQDPAVIAHRLMGSWHPDTTSWGKLIEEDDPAADASRPYPFCLAHGLDMPPQDLRYPVDWIAEWKWDGIRGQLIRRAGTHFLWSRGEELITDRFPEFVQARDFLPDGLVLDGEILAWREGPLPFSALQKRLGRKTVPKKLLQDAPVVFCAYDLLEWRGEDLRAKPLHERRRLLAELVDSLPQNAPVRLSAEIGFETWDELQQLRSTARERRAEGVMLKGRASAYQTGRTRGHWWKWKLDPLTIDGVMIYAQSGHGRRANLFTDFTFAVWEGDTLVPFAKAYSGLTDQEFGKITTWVRKNTLERFGPVRRVEPFHVFEIAFEGIQASPRHKSGIALRFPRIQRWRQDKPASEANTLSDLKEFLDL